MNDLQAVVRSAVPYRIRRVLRTVHQYFVFSHAMKRFLNDPEACRHRENPVLRDLIYGWGNAEWSAQDEYLADCIDHALTSHGSILECGSGLTTILLGTIANMRGRSYWALEHNPKWARKIRGWLNWYGLNSVLLCEAPLKDYGEFSWYDAPLDSMPGSFSLIVCDGPPGGTNGGRYGLVPIMCERLAPGCIILLDDAEREQERAIARRWQDEMSASFEIVGSIKPFIELTVMVPMAEEPRST